MNIDIFYGKPVQVICFDNWNKSAVGILQPSELGSEFCKIVPIDPKDPILKTLPVGSVITPFHIPLSIITGIFELGVQQ